jgi:hypothetical protein
MTCYLYWYSNSTIVYKVNKLLHQIVLQECLSQYLQSEKSASWSYAYSTYSANTIDSKVSSL